MNDVVIRPASSADLPRLLALLAALGPPGEPPMDLAAAAVIFARISTYPEYVVWVIERGGTLVGTYSLVVIDNLGHHGWPSALVENVVVAELQRGAGIGAAMMRHAMAHAAQRGCYKLVLSSNLARTDAHRFYDSLGFERHGISFQVTPVTEAAQA